jgi:hypothetical protein
MKSTSAGLGFLLLVVVVSVANGRLTQRLAFAIDRQISRSRVLRPFLGAAIMRSVFFLGIVPTLLAIAIFINYRPSWTWSATIVVTVIYALSASPLLTRLRHWLDIEKGGR